jgi:hypothetical protein
MAETLERFFINHNPKSQIIFETSNSIDAAPDLRVDLLLPADPLVFQLRPSAFAISESDFPFIVGCHHHTNRYCHPLTLKSPTDIDSHPASLRDTLLLKSHGYSAWTLHVLIYIPIPFHLTELFCPIRSPFLSLSTIFPNPA